MDTKIYPICVFDIEPYKKEKRWLFKCRFVTVWQLRVKFNRESHVDIYTQPPKARGGHVIHIAYFRGNPAQGPFNQPGYEVVYEFCDKLFSSGRDNALDFRRQMLAQLSTDKDR